MNPFEMVLGIIIVVTIGGVLKARYGHRSDDPQWATGPRDDAENARLRQELSALRERVQVLERVITDEENNSSRRLEREIERLRDKNSV